MEHFKSFLEQHHYFNHPYFSGLTGIIVLAIGLFIVVKNRKSSSAWAFLWVTVVLFGWFICNAVSMLYYPRFERVLLWYKIGYLFVVFMAPAFYHFYLTHLGRKSRLLYLLVLMGLLEIVYLLTYSGYGVNTYIVRNVGIVTRKGADFAYFLVFGMVKYFIVTLSTALLFFRASRKEHVPLRKQQFRVFGILFLCTCGGSTEWLVAFDIPLHIAWTLLPLFMALTAYNIIHYRALEIDTVVHQTLLWLATLVLLVLPVGILAFLIRPLLTRTNSAFQITGYSFLFFIFLKYYAELRPRIDHIFRRRKYDYQTIMGKIAERIATSININELVSRLLTEICGVMYLRNSFIYVLSRDRSRFVLTGVRGKNAPDTRILSSAEERDQAVPGRAEFPLNHALAPFLFEKKEILEKEQVEADPRYSQIREEALGWLKELEAEVVIPVFYQDQVNAVLGLGKKMSLQSYKAQDLKLLRKLSHEIGVTVFNALHYEDMAEKERLEQEMRMGQQIQMSLLPSRPPDVEHLNLEGFMLPAREIGGDYYDFIALPKEKNLGIVIGDVSGKGVAAGLCMAMVKTSVHIFARRETSPKKILLYINQVLNQHIGGEKFMTMLYLVWDADSSSLTYSSAGHEHILVYRREQEEVEAIPSGGTILGIQPDIDAMLTDRTIRLSPSDKVLLYTDGVTEAHNRLKDRFGLPQLQESFLRHSQKSARDMIRLIREDIYGFIGTVPLYDDMTLVALEVR